MNEITQAAKQYQARQARTEHPDGKFDNAGRWYPADSEWQDCCRAIRSPSRTYPYSYMTHCRSVSHVARLNNVSAAALRTCLRREQDHPTPRREGGDQYFKAVAVRPDGTMISIFDGKTQYRIGETVTDRPRQGHRGGIYVYDNARAAATAPYPAHSAASHLPRVIIRVRAEGAYCRYPDGSRADKLAFHRVTPLGVIGPVE